MTHNERQNIKTETNDIMNGVKCAERLLSALVDDYFNRGLPVKLDEEAAERVDDLFRVILETLTHSILDYNELTGELSVKGAEVRESFASGNLTMAKAEELYDKAYLMIMERVNNRPWELRYREIGNMSDTDAIPALEKLIAEMEAAA